MFELIPYNPKLKHSDKAPICLDGVFYENWKRIGKFIDIDEFDQYFDIDACSQLVLKTQCKACKGTGNKFDSITGKVFTDFKGKKIKCGFCTDGHTLLIVQDKPCGYCKTTVDNFLNPNYSDDCGHCNGSGGVSVERILEAMEMVENYEYWPLDDLSEGEKKKYNGAKQHLTNCEGILTKTD